MKAYHGFFVDDGNSTFLEVDLQKYLLKDDRPQAGFEQSEGYEHMRDCQKVLPENARYYGASGALGIEGVSKV